jgi:hypothetical protein
MNLAFTKSMNSNQAKASQSPSSFQNLTHSTAMIRKSIILSAVLIAFAGITSTASADNSRKLDLSKYQVVDNGPILEEELTTAPSKTIAEEAGEREISAPQYIWNRSTRHWEKNPNFVKTSGKAKTETRSRRS